MNNRFVTQEVIDYVHNLENELKNPTGSKISEMIGKRFGRTFSKATINKIRRIKTTEEYYTKYDSQYYKKTPKDVCEETEDIDSNEKEATEEDSFIDQTFEQMEIPQQTSYTDDIKDMLTVHGTNGYPDKSIGDAMSSVLAAVNTVKKNLECFLSVQQEQLTMLVALAGELVDCWKPSQDKNNKEE